MPIELMHLPLHHCHVEVLNNAPSLLKSVAPTGPINSRVKQAQTYSTHYLLLTERQIMAL